jgi:type VI secretion system secreted protein VgrG
MANIAQALPIILKHEVDPVKGPFSDTPFDKGGPTNYGITIATYRRYKPGATVEDLKAMPMSEVEMIYKAGYWQPLGLDEIKDQTVATKIFDICVNGGPGEASALAQRACITCGRPVKVDGWIGPETRTAINVIRPMEFLNAIKEQQRDFYMDIVQHDHTQLGFLYTWMRRSEWPLISEVPA